MERVQTPSESHWLSTWFLKHGEVTIKQVLKRRLRLTGGDFMMRVSFTLAGRVRPSPQGVQAPCYWNCYPLPRKTSWAGHLSLPFPLPTILLGTGTVRSQQQFQFSVQVLQPWLGRASEKSGHSGLAHSWAHHSRVSLWPSEMATSHPKGLHWPSKHSRLIQLEPDTLDWRSSTGRST